MAMSVISSLKAHYKLTAQDLSEEVSQPILEKLSRLYSISWRQVSPYLGLPAVVTTDIDRKPVDEGEKRREFLQKWKQMKGSDATYEKLICALLEVERRSDAEGLCQLMQDSAARGDQASRFSSTEKAIMSSQAATAHLDLKTICNELGDYKYKWFEIGVMLGIPRGKLKGFEKEDDALAAVVDYWLRNMENPSWESLASAVGSNHVNEIGLAKRIREKHCQQGDAVRGQGEQIKTSLVASAPESVPERKKNLEVAPLFVENSDVKRLLKSLIDSFKSVKKISRSDGSLTSLMLSSDMISSDVQACFEAVSLGEHDEVSMEVCSSHLKINFLPDQSEDRESTIGEVCDNVREIIKQCTPLEVGSVAMCLRCDECSELHPVEKGKEYFKMYCRKSRKSSRISSCWFNEVSTAIVVGKEDHSHATGVAASIPPVSHPGLSKQDFNKCHQKLSQYSYRWRTIGEGLGFNSAELSTIEATPSLFHGGPTAFMSEMLSKWYQWAPGDARGSKNYATVDSLAMSVDKAGLGVTANELRNLK